MAEIEFASRTARQKRENRSQTFSAPANSIRDIAFNRRIERGRLLRDACFHLFHLRLDELRYSRQRAVSRSDCRGACKNFHEARMKDGLQRSEEHTSELQ